jgi:fibronectin-binding autotransporter adhesin
MKKLIASLSVGLLLAAVSVTSSYGQATSTSTWTGTSSGAWTATGNWSPATYPISSILAVFSGSPTRTAVTIGAFSAHANGLRFDSGATAFTFTCLTTAAATELRVRGSGSAGLGQGIVNNSSSLQTFNAPVKYYSFGAGTLLSTEMCVINANSGNIGFNTGAFFTGLANPALGGNGGTLQFIAASGKTITVGSATTPGIIQAGGANSGGVIKDGDGTLVLSGNSANTYAGPTTVNAGLLTAGKVNALGTGGSLNALIVNGGTLDIGNFNQSVRGVTVAGGTINGGSGVLTGTSYSLQSGTVNAILGGASVALSKTTGGTATLGNANTYGGNTTITAGTLALGASGSIASPNIILNGGTFDVSSVSGGFSLGAGQTLKGNGSVAGGITASGTVSPGASIGTLNLNSSLTLASTANTIMEINHYAPSQNADLISAASIAMGGTLTVTDLGSGGFVAYEQFNLFDGTLTSGFSSFSLPTLASEKHWDTSGLLDGGNGVLVFVPEPSTMTCLGLGLAALLVSRRRKV